MVAEKINLEDLSRTFNSFVKQDTFDQNISLYLLNTRSDPTEIYQIEADSNIKTRIFSIITDQYDSRRFQEKEITDYDPVVTKNDTHQQLLATQYDSVWSVVSALTNKPELNHTSKGVPEERFSDYMVEFSINGVIYHAIGSFSSISKMRKIGIFANFNNNKLKQLKKDGFVGLNSRIDTLEIGGQNILIHGSQGFERVFELKKLFSKEAKRTLESENFIGHVTKESLDNMGKTVTNGGRIARRLTKLRNDESRLNDFFVHIDKVNDIVGNQNYKNFKKFDSVAYDSKTKKLSVPAGKEEQLLNIISDGNYRAEVSGHVGYDEGR
ncbi:DUF4868 domain-containing protein [Lapidilactobacillus luobeiensis]|uniref:DUF4868 domain-containing protein n=1 Tax=Lapidilactobacillus luobeiensis TaxID=2950371 RepID=UPI0021C346A5|nr:DUF4868 domain-containing protein [Lapidilactobacillus luobeiensis]